VPPGAGTLLAGQGLRHSERDAVSLPGYGWAVLGSR
jgi:cyclomaltodextrinase